MGTPLIMNRKVESAIADLKHYAEQNVLTSHKLLELVNSGKSIGDDPNFVVHIPLSYRVVFSVEEHIQKTGGTVKFRHTSISIGTPNKYPGIPAVDMIIGLLGFKNKVQSGKVIVHTEERVRAINIMEEFE